MLQFFTILTDIYHHIYRLQAIIYKGKLGSRSLFFCFSLKHLVCHLFKLDEANLAVAAGANTGSLPILIAQHALHSKLEDISFMQKQQVEKYSFEECWCIYELFTVFLE